MTILTRLEALEAALIPTTDDPGYKLLLLKEREDCEEGIIRSGLQDWPADRHYGHQVCKCQRQAGSVVMPL